MSAAPGPGCRVHRWPWMAQEPGMGWAEPQHQRPVCTVSNLVARLREHRSPGLQEEDLTTLCNIAVGKEVDNDGVLGCKERMAAQGAIEGIVHVLWAQISCVAVQEKGFMALLHLTLGDCSCTNEDNVEARKLHMIEAAALETITSGMLLHGNSAAVQLLGLAALGSITMVNGSDDEMAYAMRRLEAAGAIEATVAALQAHAQSLEMHERGFGLLCDMSSGDDDLIADQLQRMVEAGVIEAVVSGLRAHAACAKVQEDGFVVLCNLSGGIGPDTDERARLMASAGAIEVIVTGLREHAGSVELQERGFGALCNLASGGDETFARHMMMAGVIETIERGLSTHTGFEELCSCGQATLRILHAYGCKTIRAALLPIECPPLEYKKQEGGPFDARKVACAKDVHSKLAKSSQCGGFDALRCGKLAGPAWKLITSAPGDGVVMGWPWANHGFLMGSLTFLLGAY